MLDNDVARGSAGPTVHGVYDYFLGGVDHLRADRELAKAVEEKFPSVPSHVRAARDFHLRAARWCAERGVTRFLCCGVSAWKPTIPNVLDAAREIAPASEAVHVHRGAQAHARARAKLTGPGTCDVLAQVNYPAGLLSAAPVDAMLAEGRPVCLMLAMTAHFETGESARAQIAAYAKALPPGSVIAMSVALAGESPRAGELLSMFTPAKVYRHTAEDVAGWLEDAGLEIEPPGVADVRAVLGRAWAADGLPPGAPGMTAGALGVKP